MINELIMSNNLSMRDIAEAAGVSKAAVSRVMNGGPAGIRVSDETRSRILAIVRVLSATVHSGIFPCQRGRNSGVT